MAFDTPSLDDQTEIQAAHFAHCLPQDDVSVRSPNWLWAKTQAAGVVSNNSNIVAAKNDLLPDTCVRADLDRWGAILNLPRKRATGGAASAGLTVSGAPTTVVTAGLILTDASGQQYQTVDAGGVIGAGGYVNVDIAAISTGASTNLDVGQALTFQAPPAGVNGNAVIAVALTDGLDDELDGDYRARLLLRLSSPPEGGAATDYVQWATAILGVAGAYCYPLRQGIGTVDLAVLAPGSGTVRAPSGGLIATVLSTINALRPVGVKAFRVLTVVPSTVNTEYQVIPTGDPSTTPDWDASAGWTVLTWTAGTNTLQFPGGTRPPTLQAGQRLIIAQGATGKERVVQALSGADSVVLEFDPTGDTPAVGNNVYSGGPLVQPARAAIQALFDSLGTANPDAVRYGPWEGDLRPGSIDRVGRGSSPGVLDGNVITPNAKVEANDPASDPTDSTIGLLIAGRILVHY